MTSSHNKPVIFLDVDGVINWFETDDRYDLDDDLIQNLKTLVDRFNANIVLTSSWRVFVKPENGELVPEGDSKRGRALIDRLSQHGLKIHELVSEPVYYENGYRSYGNKNRADEVIEYVNKNNVTRYVVLDDEDYGFDRDHYVQTSYGHGGFNKQKLQEAMAILEKGVSKK